MNTFIITSLKCARNTFIYLGFQTLISQCSSEKMLFPCWSLQPSLYLLPSTDAQISLRILSLIRIFTNVQNHWILKNINNHKQEIIDQKRILHHSHLVLELIEMKHTHTYMHKTHFNAQDLLIPNQRTRWGRYSGNYYNNYKYYYSSIPPSPQLFVVCVSAGGGGGSGGGSAYCFYAVCSLRFDPSVGTL